MSNLLDWWRQKSLKSENVDTRRRAVEKLAGKSGKSTSTLLIHALDDPDADVRTRAADVLAHLGDPRAVRPLVDLAVRERECSAADRITHSLSSLDKQETISALCEALYGDDPRARLAAAAALRRVAWMQLPDGVKAEVAIIQDDWTTAVKIGASAIGPLHEVLLTGTPQEKRNAVESLGKIGTPAAFRVLCTTFDDETADEATRRVAGWGLRLHFWKQVGPVRLARIAIMHEEWSHVAKCGPPAVPALEEALKRGSLDVRRAAAQTLGEMRCPAASDALAHALLDQEQDHRVWEAIRTAIEASAPQRDTPSLVQELIGPHWPMRVAAAKALESRSWTPRNDADRAILAIAAGRWNDVQTWGAAAIEPLLSALQYPPLAAEAARALMPLGDEAVDRVMQTIGSPHTPPAAREKVSAVLAELRHPRALEPLAALLKDPDITIRVSAVWQLEQAGWKPASEQERALAAIAHEDWNSLRRCGPGAVEPLIRVIESGTALEQAVPAMEALVEAATSRLPVPLLRQLTALRVRTDEADTNPDFTKIHRLAKSEMNRRGLLK